MFSPAEGFDPDLTIHKGVHQMIISVNVECGHHSEANEAYQQYTRAWPEVTYALSQFILLVEIAIEHFKNPSLSFWFIQN